MTGPEHYRAAEVLVEQARHLDDLDARTSVIGAAQVHATLALAAATAALDATEGPAGGSATGRTVEDWRAWDEVLTGGEPR